MRRAACIALTVAAAALLPGSALAHGKGRAKFHPDWASHPSTRYGAMTAPQCVAELTRRGVAFTPVEDALGVLAPVRLPRGVGGVTYRTAVPEVQRATSPFDVFDCRLVLALSDFSKILVTHDIDEVVMFSAWRPPAKRFWPAGKVGTRHPGALAIDAAKFGKRLAPGEDPKQRVWLEVLGDFHGTLGAPACGAGAAAPTQDSPAARELRSIVCETADQHLFTSILTPNFNRAHANHFHLEVTPGVKWFLML